MTREEAIKRLGGILTEAVEFENSVCYVTEEDREPLEMAIKALEQEPKTGRWITVENEEMETIGYYCSECDLPMETENQTRFCPNCGAKMVEPQERSDKE